LITEPYRDQYRQLYATEQYGGRGFRWTREADRLLTKTGCRTVIDYGCGQGSLGASLERLGYTVRYYDPAFPALSAPTQGVCDGIVCTDVLEHVEPQCLASVLGHIRSLMGKAGLFVISTRPAKRRLPNGTDPHLLVKRSDWWIERLLEHGLAPTLRRDLSSRHECVLEAT